MKKLFFCLVVAMLLVSMSSCRHKDFCYFHPHAEIYVDVQYDDYGDPDDHMLLTDGTISATRLMAYHAESGKTMLTSDIDRTVNLLPLSIDTYHFLAHNAGTKSISFSDNDIFFAHCVSTRTCDIVEPLYDSRAVSSNIDLGNGEEVVVPAEPIWVAGLSGVECKTGDVVQMIAVPLHCRYTFEMRNVTNLEYVDRISSFITGMARGATTNNALLHDATVTVAVPASVDETGKNIVGSFMCFGNHDDIEVAHRMGLFVELNNGIKIRLTEGDKFDVTTQVDNAPNRRRVHIIIDGVVIPTGNPDNNEQSGFDVTVNPWDDGENKDIDVKL